MWGREARRAAKWKGDMSPRRGFFHVRASTVNMPLLTELALPPFRNLLINRQRFTFAAWKNVVLIALFALATLAAVATATAAGKQDARPTPANPGPAQDKSVEALAEIARQSVVVISHFGRDGKEDGIGAGFVVSSNGLIATSLHVIGEARPITVQLAGGKRYSVTEVHAWDRKLDLAVIRIAAENLPPPLSLGDSDTLKQGTPVVAMGNPLGLERSIVQGVVSARRDF